MPTEFLADLIVNVALYCAAAVAFGWVVRRLDHVRRFSLEAAIGLGLGFTAVAGMLTPIQIDEGIVFDGRAIAVAAAGMFGGPVGALAAIAPPAIYRMELGGAGLIPALINLALAGGLGALVRWRAQRSGGGVEVRHVIVAGVCLPFASYLAFPFFPTLELGWAVFQKVGLTLAIAMPLGFLALGLLLLDEQARHDMLRELRARKSLFDAIHADIPALLFQRTRTYDGRPKFNYVSESSRRLLDRTPEELYADPNALIEAIHPDDREAFLTTIRHAEAKGILPHYEYRTVSREGQVRWLRVTAAGSQVNDEFVWNGVTLDVTHIKEIEEEEYALAQIVRDSAVPIIRADADFRIQYFNEAAERLYGYRSEEVVGMPAAIFRPPERIDAMAAFLNELKEDMKPGSIRTVSLHKSGRRMPMRLDLTPLIDHDGVLVGWATMCLDMTEQQRAEDEMQRLATTDALTRLPNRRSFDERAATEIARARRYGRPLALVMADIDFFKQVNDEYGHAAGDHVLASTADLLQHILRSSGDFAARLGGEEFALLLPECTHEGAALLAERLRIGVMSSAVRVDGVDIAVTCSFGVSQWHPAEDDIDAALQRADKALYEAKAAGRNQVMVTPPPALTVAPGEGRGRPISDLALQAKSNPG